MPRDFQPTVSFGLHLIAIGAMMLLAMLAAMPASAQELDPNSPPPANDHVSCGHFDSRASAQETLDSGLLDELGRQSLDGDSDGIACEDAFLDPNSPPPARDYVSCGHFETQADAQEALDSGNLDELGRQSLDGDGDGIACENAFDTTEPATDTDQETTGVVRLPNTGTGIVETLPIGLTYAPAERCHVDVQPTSRASIAVRSGLRSFKGDTNRPCTRLFSCGTGPASHLSTDRSPFVQASGDRVTGM